MAILNHIILGILILQICAHAAPSDEASKLEDIAKVEKAQDTPEDITRIEKVADKLDFTPKEVESEGDSTETSRQKRQFYNPFGYGPPPLSKLIYSSSFSNRDNFDSFGPYGYEDPLVQIHKRVQEIAGFVRQPPSPPIQHIPHIPIFYPVLFVPPIDCGCNPTEPSPTDTTLPDNNTLAPNVTNRFPEMEDERQNWGFVSDDDTNTGGGDEDPNGQDFSRPISFDPIKINRPNARPAPPVEHGTVQSESGNSVNSQSSGNFPPPPPPPPSTTRRPQQPPQIGLTQNPFNAPRQPARRPPPPGPPTPCDGAILTCCHQPQVVYDCFAIQGCPNFTPYGNPCETNSILRVIEKFQRFYDSRNG